MSTAFKRRAGGLLMRALLYLNSYGQLQITHSLFMILVENAGTQLPCILQGRLVTQHISVCFKLKDAV